MKRMIIAATLALGTALAFALPSTEDVQAAVRAGNYAQADSMMHEVVAAKPQSAKAHYVYAEILAHEGKFADAATQARSAREIDPALSFTDPAKFRSFEQELQRAQGQGTAPQVTDQTVPAHAPPSSGAGVPGWVWAAGVAVVAFLVLRAVMRRVAANAGGGYVRQGTYPMPGNAGGYGAGYGPGYGYGNGPSPGGSALRTGLAAAGGLAAGMLAEKYLEGRREDEYNQGGNGNFQPNWDNGQGAAANDLENRSIDFGNGGGWDAGGGSDGGGFDPGGGGSSDGW
jgi:hypothetical protein